MSKKFWEVCRGTWKPEIWITYSQLIDYWGEATQHIRDLNQIRESQL